MAKIISSEEQEHTGKVMNLEYSNSVPVVGVKAGLWTGIRRPIFMFLAIIMVAVIALPAAAFKHLLCGGPGREGPPAETSCM